MELFFFPQTHLSIFSITYIDSLDCQINALDNKFIGCERRECSHLAAVVKEAIPEQERWALLLEKSVAFREIEKSGMMFQLQNAIKIAWHVQRTAENQE